MKVLIFGLGQYPQGSGVSAAVYFAEKGEDVRVTDLRSEKELGANVRRLKKFKNVEFVLGKHRKSDIRWADIIIRNPGVRQHSVWMTLARQFEKRIESDVSLFMEACPCPVVGITGTRGKSTTSALTAEMLKASGKKTWLGGNIKVSPLTFIDNVRADHVVVLELSSWLVETLGERGMSPQIACITNIMRDHLNAYENMEAYVEAKAQIFRHQRPDDILVLNADDSYTKQFQKEAPSTGKTFSLKKKADSDRLIAVKDLRLLGEHNLANARAAAVIARSAGATLAGIRKAVKSFAGLPDRLEVIAEKKGILFINDTTATTPDATMAAVRAISQDRKTIHLIFGGADKELEFDDVASLLKKKKICISVFDGTAFSKIEKAFKKANASFQSVSSMKESVTYHRKHAKKGDVILLSPGCASFGMFRNEFERGDQFKKVVRKI